MFLAARILASVLCFSPPRQQVSRSPRKLLLHQPWPFNEGILKTFLCLQFHPLKTLMNLPFFTRKVISLTAIHSNMICEDT